MNLTFTDVNYFIRISHFSKKKKQVISSLNGNFRAGNLTAIMGPSGAGKSSLMNILAGFTTSGVSGNICVNGCQRNLTQFRHSSVYIMQEDNLQPLLTVLEAMHFAMDLKLEPDRTCWDNRQKVQRILKNIGLKANEDTLTRNLSGGQKKRLAIALELISNPGIIFLDEPTSGLDNVSSRRIFELLKSLAREGRAVICILHQPSETIFEMIDHLYVLGKGHCVYSGSPKNVLAYLADLGFHCPIYHNPADYLMEVVNGEYGDQTMKLVAASVNQRACFSHDPNMAVPAIEENEKSYNTCSSWRQIRTLIRCNMVKLSRDRVLMYLRLNVSCVLGLLIGTLFYGIGQDAAYSFNNFSMLALIVLCIMVISMNTSLVSFPLELPVLKREYFNRWYNLHSFYLANRIADLPLQLLAVIIYTSLIYYMSGQLMEYKRLGSVLVTSLLISLVSQMIGLIVGARFDVYTAAIVGPVSLVPTFIFSGFFVHHNHAPRYLQWLFHLSFCKYGFDGVMYATYGLNRSRLACSAPYCHFASPKLILKDFGVESLDYWFSVTVLAGLYTFLNFIAYFTLKNRLKLQKK